MSTSAERPRNIEPPKHIISKPQPEASSPEKPVQSAAPELPGPSAPVKSEPGLAAPPALPVKPEPSPITVIEQKPESAPPLVKEQKPELVTPTPTTQKTDTLQPITTTREKPRKMTMDEHGHVVYIPTGKDMGLPIKGKLVYVSPGHKEGEYIIRLWQPGGGYIQKTVSLNTVLALGGEIPLRGNVWAMDEGLSMVGLASSDTRNSVLTEFDMLDTEWDTFEKMLERFKNNPLSPEFALKEAGGTITKEQKDRLSKLAGVTYDTSRDLQQVYKYQQEIKKDLIPVGTNLTVGNFQAQVIKEYTDENDITPEEAMKRIDALRNQKYGDGSERLGVLKGLTTQEIDKLGLVLGRVDARRDYVSEKDLNKIQETDKELADVLLKKGFEAYELRADSKNLSRLHRWEAELKKTDPEGYEVYKEAGGGEEGFDALDKLVNDRVDKFEAELKKTDPEGYEVYKKDGYDAYLTYRQEHIESWENALKSYDPEGYEVYKKDGYDAYTTFCDQREVKWQQQDEQASTSLKKHQAALESLKEYRIDPTPEQVKIFLETGGKEGQVGYAYDVQKFIEDHPTEDSIRILKDARFNRDTINDAENYVDATQSVLKEINTFFSGNGLDIANAQVMDVQADRLGFIQRYGKLNKPQETGIWQIGDSLWGDETYMILGHESFWNSLTDKEKNQLAGAMAVDPNRGNGFAAVMGSINYDYEKFPVAVKYAIPFMPGGMLTLGAQATGTTIGKALTGQEITPMEIAVDAALMSVGFIGIGGIKTLPFAKTRTASGEYILKPLAEKMNVPLTIGLSTGAGSVFAVHTAQEWNDMTAAEKGLSITMTALMFAPLAAFLKKPLVNIIAEPNVAMRQRAVIREIFDYDRALFKKYLSNNPRNPKNYANEFDIAYKEWTKQLQDYAETRLKLAQAREAVEGIKFAETPQTHKLLRVFKARIRILESKLPGIQAKAEKATNKYVDTMKKVAGVDDPAVLQEWGSLGQRAIRDMDVIAESVVKPRSIKEIRLDIDKAVRETAGLAEKDPIKKNALIIQTDYLNALNRELYMTRLSKLKKLYQNTLKAETLAKQIREAGSIEIKTKLEKQLLEIEAKNTEIKEKLFEGIHKTSDVVAESIELKPPLHPRQAKIRLRLEYSGQIQKLKYIKERFLSRIDDIKAKERIKDSMKDLEKAFNENDAVGIKTASDALFKESPAVRQRLNNYIEAIKKSASERDTAIKKWQADKSIENKKLVDELTSDLNRDFNNLVDDVKKDISNKDSFKKKFQEWEQAEAKKEAARASGEEALSAIEERAKFEAEKAEQLKADRFDKLINDKERAKLKKYSDSYEWRKKDAADALEYARKWEKEIAEVDFNSLSKEQIFELRKQWNEIYARQEKLPESKSFDGPENLKARADEIIEDLFNEANKEQRRYIEAEKDYREILDDIYQRVADSKFNGDMEALEQYIEEGIFKETGGEGLPGIDNLTISKQIIDEAEKILRESSDDALSKALREIDEILKKSPDELNETIKDIERQLKKVRDKTKEPPRESGAGKTKVAVKEKTETKTKTAEELEKELYKEPTKKPQEKPSEEALKKLKKAEEELKAKPKPRTKPAPFKLPAKKYSPAPYTQPLETVKDLPLPKKGELIRVGTEELERPYPLAVPETQTSTELRTLPLPGILTIPASQTMPVTETQPETQTQPQPSQQAAQQVAIQTITSTETKPSKQPAGETTLKPTETKPGEPSKPKKAVAGGGGDKDREWTPEEIKSALAWQDGFVVHALKSPYRPGIDNKSFHISNVPPGLVVMKGFKGPGSQQKSARVTGKFPAKLTIDVGNQDVIVTRGRGGRVSMKHVRDTTGSVSQTTIKRLGRNASKKRGRVYHTKMGGGTTFSRRPIRRF